MSASRLLHNRFEVHDALGEGGMGIVFRGHDRHTGRPVAIKTLRADASDWQPSALDRFRREAEVLRQLNHPNIVQVLATIEQAGRTYIVMEYVEGGSLAARLRRDQPLPLDQVLSIALDVADALTRVHRLGILHRDLKPENVLLAADGSARLSDFGIAYLTGTSGLTHDGSILGTLQYLSPEALSGEPLDSRSDVWAFGVVLFEMLAGRPPFVGDIMPRVIVSIMTDRVPDLEALRPDAPVGLIDLIYRMLEKESSARLRSVRLAGAELEALLDPIARAEYRGPSVASAAVASLAAARSAFTSASTVTKRGPVHNLPAQTTPLVGRTKEMAELERLLVAGRMVTVVGAGGSGKTRVAQELGRAQIEHYQDGVFFVPLAPLRDVAEIVTAVGDAVGLEFMAGAPRDHQLLAWLKDRSLLLILDNFEHVLDGAALVSTMLDAAAGVAIVTTSREPLGLTSETLFRLEGVDVPQRNVPPELLASYGAVELFLQSARRAYPAFRPRDDDLTAIATIGRVVGGSPLAIVLAASWVEVLSAPEILQEIRRNLDFLEADSRHAEERHRSMHVVFDAAWQRLSPDEQAQFARTAVFRGGFTREAAVQITGASLRTLANLVRHSLLHRDPATGRYDVHELLRQYAERRLDASQERDDAEARHGVYYAALLHGSEDRFGGPDKGKTLVEIDAELDNIRAAWDSAVRRGDLAVIGPSLTALALFYSLRTMNEEAVARLGSALDMVRALRERAPLELELGLQVRWTAALMNLKGYGHPDVGVGFARAHELCKRLGPSPLLAPVMFGLWAFYIIGAQHDIAQKLAQQLLDIGVASGNPVLEIGGHHAVSGSSVAAGELQRADRHATRVMELYRPDYDPLIIAFVNDHSASAARGWHAVSLLAMGHLGRARAVEHELRAFIEQLGHGQTHAQGFMFLYMPAWIRRDYEAAAGCARELRRAGERYALPVYAVLGDAFLACASATPATIDSLVEASGVIHNAFGFKAMSVAMVSIRKAELCLAAGDLRGARAAAEQNLEWIRVQRERFFESDALRVRGDVERAEGDLSSAEASYRDAIDVARGQHAWLFELRATNGLCRLWQAQGRHAEARKELQPIVDGFTEGLDTVDVRESVALLAELQV